MNKTVRYGLTESQAHLLEAMNAAGATKPDAARPLGEFPRITNRELDELIDRGLLREASLQRFYTFEPRRLHEPPVVPAPPAFGNRGSRRRLVLTLVFWIVVLALPMLLLSLAGR